MYELNEVLDKIYTSLASKKNIFPICEICYIPEGVSNETIYQLISLRFIICKNTHNNDGSIPIVVFLHNNNAPKTEVITSINQVIKCKYPGFEIIQED